MSEEVLIKVEGVRKKFCRSLKKSLWYGMNDMAAECVGGSRRHDELRPDEFWAVDDVSFQLRRGECLGLIGRNGAGKSTLLKMLNGLIKPDRGRIEMQGRIGALIALGTGFNPILTGRENIYVNGSVLGLAKNEIEGKIEDIIDFSDIREFIDTPVQSYSSGMQVRLGFAIATALQPDILLLDEVLAVGDASFRHKCYNRIGKIQSNAAVIFVTHNMQQIAQLCDRVLVMHQGRLVHYGEIKNGIDSYDKINTVPSSQDNESEFERIEAPVLSARFDIPNKLKYGEILSVKSTIRMTLLMQDCYIRFCFYDLQGLMVAEWDSSRHNQLLDLRPGDNNLKFEIGPVNLRSDKYYLGIQLHDNNPLIMPIWRFKLDSVVVDGVRGGGAPCILSSPLLMHNMGNNG